jgi:hypothetical protein
MNIFFFGGKGAIGSMSKKVADNRGIEGLVYLDELEGIF